MNQRDSQLRTFLEGAGFEANQLDLLTADASPRRYFRVESPGPSVLLMDSTLEDLQQFVLVARHLVSMGLSAPRIYHTEIETGLALIEDFGDDTFARLLDGGENQSALYERALDTLIALHTAPDACRIQLSYYDMDALLKEATLFVDWCLPEVIGQKIESSSRDSFCDIWYKLLKNTASRRDVLVLRDYHMDNLMSLPEREGIAACGLLDFQDAVLGARAYDVMSILQDARRDVSAPLEQYLLQYYFEAFPALDCDTFMRDYTLLAAQRHMKVAGIFFRLFRRDGKLGYLKHIPRVIRLLEQALEHPLLAPMQFFLDQEAPRWPTLASIKSQ